MNRFKSIGTIF